MDLSYFCPFFAATIAGVFVAGGVWKQLRPRAIGWDAVVAATLLTGVAIAIIRIPLNP